jgi:hypothetical protein
MLALLSQHPRYVNLREMAEHDIDPVYKQAFSRDLFTQVSVADEAQDQCGSRREWIFVETLRRYVV